MPLQLTNDIGDGYWFHNSGGEHTGKHALDPQEVLALARSAQTSLALSHDELWKLMYNDGLFVAMTYRDDEGVGAVAGYAIAERSPDKTSIDVKDVFVVEEHRGRGVGGYLLGRLVQSGQFIFPHPEMSVHQIPETASYRGQSFRLTGDHVTIYSRGERSAFKARLEEFRRHIATKGLTRLLEVTYEGKTEEEDFSQLTLFQKGKPTELDRSKIIGSGSEVLLGVINYINRTE
jgi:GNAT superfamily N-acetyltransferase